MLGEEFRVEDPPGLGVLPCDGRLAYHEGVRKAIWHPWHVEGLLAEQQACRSVRRLVYGEPTEIPEFDCLVRPCSRRLELPHVVVPSRDMAPFPHAHAIASVAYGG